MLWLGLILVIQISILNPAFASEICPPSKFLNGLNECVPCSPCKEAAKPVEIRACSGHVDTLCGTIYDLATQSPSKPKVQLVIGEETSIGKWQSLPKRKSSKKDDDNVFNVVSNPDYDESNSRSSRVEAEKKTTNESRRLAGKHIMPNDSDNLMHHLKGSTIVDAAKKFGFNKNGKHIKKDLSMSDSGKLSSENSTSAAVESILNQTSAANSKKAAKTKAKKNLVNVNDHPVSITDTKFLINGEDINQPFSFVHPHIDNHRIYLEMDEDVAKDHEKASSTLFTAAKPDVRPPNPSILFKNSFTINKTIAPAKNNTDLLQFHQLIGGLAQVLSNNSHEKNESGRIAEKSAVIPKQTQDSDYLADETDSDDDVDEDDDDEDSDDEDDDYDENDEDEDDDDDEDEDTDSTSSKPSSAKKTKHPPFGAGSTSHSLDLDDDEDDDDEDGLKLNEDDDYGIISEGKSSNKKWLQGEPEVNVEPYSNSPDWQLLMLVSAVSACLLFFVFVNVYICIYMKKWKHMKSTFEADVEDLSVRINLMQHGGLDIDDPYYVKNYMTQLKNGRTSEKSSRTNLREK